MAVFTTKDKTIKYYHGNCLDQLFIDKKPVNYRVWAELCDFCLTYINGTAYIKANVGEVTESQNPSQ